jgi:hypothetical protein
MEPWVVNVENYINVIYPVSGTLEAFYALPEDSYTQISGSFTSMGDNRYFIKHTFLSEGSYLIKIEDTDNPDNTVLSSVDVVGSSVDEVQELVDALPATIQGYLTGHNDTIQTDLSSLDTGLRQILTNLGDEINVNEVLIANASKSMSVTI